MKLGLDLSVLQTPHRMRGIGATAINFVNNIDAKSRSEDTFIFYLYKANQEEALSILNLNDLNYEIRNLKEIKNSNVNLPRGSRIANSIINNVKSIALRYRGDPRVLDVSGLDSFLQFDPMQLLPKSKKIKKALVIYDLIPYIMEYDYLWNYKTARKHNYSRKAALKRAFIRHRYIVTARSACKSADLMIAISKNTKEDYIKYAGINSNDIKVIYLGIENKNDYKTQPPSEHYISNSWGYFTHSFDITDKPFLLYVGGADPRRKLIHLVAAYNNIKAQGIDIRLVLAGDTMKGPYAIPVTEVQKYISESSYLDDIVFLGFVADSQREWLYKNATALVYPSVYEGFGLPILEAMQYGTPVITYKNSSIYEIASDAALYAFDAISIQKMCEELINNSDLRDQYSKRGKLKAAEFSWAVTTRNILKTITS